MKLEEVKKEYHIYTDAISKIARQLAFAGIAVVWIFKTDAPSGPKVPHVLLWPMFFLVLTLALDFLQYGYGAVMYHISFERFERKKNRTVPKLPETHNFPVSVRLVRPMDVFFYLKLVAVAVAYVLLILHLYRQLWQ